MEKHNTVYEVLLLKKMKLNQTTPPDLIITLLEIKKTMVSDLLGDVSAKSRT